MMWKRLLVSLLYCGILVAAEVPDPATLEPVVEYNEKVLKAATDSYTAPGALVTQLATIASYERLYPQNAKLLPIAGKAAKVLADLINSNSPMRYRAFDALATVHSASSCYEFSLYFGRTDDRLDSITSRYLPNVMSYYITVSHTMPRQKETLESIIAQLRRRATSDVSKFSDEDNRVVSVLTSIAIKKSFENETIGKTKAKAIEALTEIALHKNTVAQEAVIKGLAQVRDNADQSLRTLAENSLQKLALKLSGPAQTQAAIELARAVAPISSCLVDKATLSPERLARFTKMQDLFEDFLADYFGGAGPRIDRTGLCITLSSLPSGFSGDDLKQSWREYFYFSQFKPFIARVPLSLRLQLESRKEDLSEIRTAIREVIKESNASVPSRIALETEGTTLILHRLPEKLDDIDFFGSVADKFLNRLGFSIENCETEVTVTLIR